MADFDITRIAGNIGAMNALNSLQNINKQLSIHQTRLSTGKRINSAADDPAGLTIATKLDSRSEGLKTALSNIGDAKNLLAVAESGMSRINDILVQMQNKSESAASDTMGSSERSAIVTQLQAYAAQIDDISSQTEWNGVKLINGDFSATPLTFQTGASKGDTTTVSNLLNLSATGASGLQIAAKTGAASAAVSADANDILLDSTPVGVDATINSNLSELQNGTYTVKVVASGATSKVHLLDSSGNEMLIGQDNLDGSGTVAKGVTVDLSGTGFTAANFGNGLWVELNNGLADGTYTAQVDYSKADSYAITFNDGGGDTTLTSASSASDFSKYMDYIGNKLDTVSGELAKIGALTGRLTFKEDQVSAAQVNVEAAYDRIMDADMAEEQVNSSKFQILQQTAVAMLAQANAAPQYLLSLFK